MFRLITVEDVVRIPPNKFGDNLEKVAHEELESKYGQMVGEDLGYVIAITELKVNPVGKIISGDGGPYHDVVFTLLTFYPYNQEIIEGEVVEIADFGAFVRIGPVDALLHVSQIIDDFVTYDERQAVLLAKESGKILKQGDQVRVRIVAVSFARGGASGKIGVTTRQPSLGKIEWIEEDLRKIREEAKPIK